MSPPALHGIPRQVGDALDEALANNPTQLAVIGRDQRLTYSELDKAVDQAAAALFELGIRATDPIGVSLPNCAEIVVLFYAIMRLGAIFVGINRGLAPPEKSYILDDSNTRILVTTERIAEEFRGFTEVAIATIIEERPNEWRKGVPDSSQGYPRANSDDQQIAGLAYTSGTTGRPKGVVHSHRNLLLPGAALVANRGYGADLRRGDCAALTILNLQVTSTLLTAQAARNPNRHGPCRSGWYRHMDT